MTGAETFYRELFHTGEFFVLVCRSVRRTKFSHFGLALLLAQWLLK